MNKLAMYKMLEGIDTKRALFGTFFAFDNRLQTAGDAFYEEITVKQFFLLIALQLFQGKHPTIGELSEVMGSSHQNVKQLVNKLVKSGLLKTYLDPQDRRKLRIMHTKKMKDFSEKYSAKEVDFLEKFYQGVSDEEVEATFNTISKIEKNLIKIRNEYK